MSGFFQPKDPASFANSTLATNKSITFYLEDVDALDRSSTTNSTKNVARIKSIIEEDMGIHLQQWTDSLGESHEADLPASVTHNESEARLEILIEGLTSLEQLLYIARIARMIWQNQQDDEEIIQQIMTTWNGWSDFMTLDSSTPFIVDDEASILQFNLLSGNYPPGPTDADNIYQSMFAFFIRAYTGINVISNDYTWITFSYYPESSPTHYRVRLAPSTEMQRIARSKFIWAVVQGVLNPYQLMYSVCNILAT